MQLLADTCVHSTAVPMGSEAHRLRLQYGYCRGFRDVLIWIDSSSRANLLDDYPSVNAIDQPCYLSSNLDLAWNYTQNLCCEQLFCDHKSGLFQLESSGAGCSAHRTVVAGDGEQPTGQCAQATLSCVTKLDRGWRNRHELYERQRGLAAAGRGQCRSERSSP